ncbi:AbrB/MazE/SpoVT family DNA-binding domain-containing protein [Thermosulfurimonas sp. F29]|uniref:AbrB/MazE/SpoVT family DNA-binding domain-containing protein n=1 Tax=Thermosulfurimonas sp. F29 TaxID=2867247 RepID=UPI001C83B743|nr:AbrB/MazE/SpoVT family DNA-binding domain-containing protein [Thermosulfurimonas sp. F29]MBX6422048.1 AbrB/MazE/SpoVT family DNA-binding domain-containing protein [Thermosulfurimonas sp. F29]
MPLATVTSKGQITLPKPVREALKLRIGDKVEITIEDGKAVLRPLSKRVEEVFGKLSREGKGYTVEEMDAHLKEEIKRRWK